MDLPESNIKHLRLTELETAVNQKKIKEEAKTKEKTLKQKVLAQTEEWTEYILSNLSLNAQKHVVNEAIRLMEPDLNTNANTPVKALTNQPVKSLTNQPVKILNRLIKIKQQGYKAQDIEKTKYDKEKFVDVMTILEKLRGSELLCFYCKEPVKVFYEYCRDPKQWTLERINNDYGHNCDNVEIACLQCNIGRKTMYYERYQITKQCVIRKLDHEES